MSSYHVSFISWYKKVPSFFSDLLLVRTWNCDLSLKIVFGQKSTKNSHSASYGITALLASQYIAESLKRSNSRSPSGCTARPRPRDQGLRPMSIHSTVPARPTAARPPCRLPARPCAPGLQLLTGTAGTAYPLSSQLNFSAVSKAHWNDGAAPPGAPYRCTPARCRSPCSPDRGRPRCSRPRPLCRRRATPGHAVSWRQYSWYKGDLRRPGSPPYFITSTVQSVHLKCGNLF